MTIDSLLTDVSAEEPAGPNLEYDADVAELFRAAKGRPEQQVGETLVSAKEPDWSDVRMRAEAALRRSKDVRFAILWARAATRIEGILGFDAGVKLVHGLVARFWESGYPPLDVEDNDDPTLRLNALADLNDPETLLRDLRLAVFVKGPDVFLEVRDILAASGAIPSLTGKAPDPSQIERVLRDHADGAARPAIAAVGSIRAEVAALRAFLEQKVGADRLPDWPILDNFLAALVKTVQPLAAGMAEGTEGSSGTVGLSSPSGTGEIRNREDAYGALERICEFIERTEPAHPAPLLIRRAQRLLKKNFLEIVEDLSPDSLSSIRRLGGLKDE